MEEKAQFFGCFRSFPHHFDSQHEDMMGHTCIFAFICSLCDMLVLFLLFLSKMIHCYACVLCHACCSVRLYFGKAVLNVNVNTHSHC